MHTTIRPWKERSKRNMVWNVCWVVFWAVGKCEKKVQFYILCIPVLKSHLSKTSTISCPIKTNGKWVGKICERNNSLKANCSYFHIIQKYKIAWAKLLKWFIPSLWITYGLLVSLFEKCLGRKVETGSSYLLFSPGWGLSFKDGR